jgi:hypothetical protein
MQVHQFPWNYTLDVRFPHRRTIFGYEGGHVDAAEADGKSYIIVDEDTMADFLSESDPTDADILSRLITVMEFDTVDERDREVADMVAAHEARLRTLRQKHGWPAENNQG